MDASWLKKSHLLDLSEELLFQHQLEDLNHLTTTIKFLMINQLHGQDQTPSEYLLNLQMVWFPFHSPTFKLPVMLIHQLLIHLKLLPRIQLSLLPKDWLKLIKRNLQTKKELKRNKIKLLNPQRKKLKFKRKKINLKLKVKPSNFLVLLKNLNQSHSKPIIINHGMLEDLTMPPELLLKSKFNPNKKMKLPKMLQTKRVLMPLPLPMLNLIASTLKIEKVLPPTHGMSTGLPKLFHNQRVMHIALIDN